MWSLARAQIHAGWPRLVPGGIALMIATAIISVALMSGTVISNVAMRMFALDYGNTDVVVSNITGSLDSATIEDIAAEPLASTVVGDTTGVVGVAHDGTVSNELFVPTQPEEFARYSLAEGRAPANAGEVALTESQAETYGVGLGDSITIALTIPAANADDVTAKDGTVECEGETCSLRVPVTVTGFVHPPPLVVSEVSCLVLSPDDIAAWHDYGALPESVDRLLISSPDPAGLIASITANYPENIAATSVREASQLRFDDTTGNTALIPAIVIVFATLAMVVAGLIIANTFHVTVAHRVRHYALLRCVGAQRSQIHGAVMYEAAVVGLVAGLSGVLLGYGLIAALLAYLANLPTTADLSMSIPISAVSIVVPALISIVISLIASLWPANIATRQEPLEVLSGAETAPMRLPTKLRFRIGLGLFLGGVIGLGVSLLLQPWLRTLIPAFPVLPLTLGFVCVFIAALIAGLAVLAPRILPPITRSLARGIAAILPGNYRVPIRLTQASLQQQPGRTTAATMAVFLTTALVALSSVGTAVVRSSVSSAFGNLFAFDLEVHTDGTKEGLSESFFRSRLEGLPGVGEIAIGRASHLGMAFGTDDVRTAISVIGVDPVAVTLTTRIESLPKSMGDDVLVIGQEYGIPEEVTQVRLWRLPSGDLPPDHELLGPPEGGNDTDPMSIGEIPKDAVTLRVVHAPSGTPTMLTRTTFDSLVPDAKGLVALAHVNPDDSARAVESVQTAFASSSLGSPFWISGSAVIRGAVDQVLSVLVAVVAALLAIAVFISFVGVTNTLMLSAIERRREVALLRAVGMTKRQLRMALASEGFLMTVIGTTLGIACGGLIGAAGSAFILHQADVPVEFSLPLRFLVLLVALTVPAGIISSILPAHTVLKDFQVEDLAE
ncbi:hypothetical protein BSZ39_03130 [Bowdeniella nasicola]|uniref:ABC3 transporter permease C-terminal domain-containing protein n=1 Tax=Bowdeniella nasicola TaxID=208480 RepID=A0A1Q5Q474_9ACTO|nr:ABC transporter permease [Bowdeniella nasicola]OKL54606.1 hypothetical protein BSZ39_03130 [Bowdeniella nasicola]